MNIREMQVSSVKRLLDDGATIPFIARYRKEATGELDEVQVQQIKTLLEKYEDLEKRKLAIIKSLKESDSYTDKLGLEIKNASSLVLLEDIYLPYKPKRKTRGVKAKELGLEPLAMSILSGEEYEIKNYLTDSLDSKMALAGAKDIIAEIISEDRRVRGSLRRYFEEEGILQCKVVKAKKDEALKFKDYFDFNQILNNTPSHRILAILRGSSEGFLKFHIEPNRDYSIAIIDRLYAKGPHKKIIHETIEDSYKRLLYPSIETEIKNKYKKIADEKAIDVFQDNLRELLLSSPLGGKKILAIDPGLRSGSKIACLSREGEFLEYQLIKPLPPHNQFDDSKRKIMSLCKKYNIEAITIGNGTGGREMEEFCRELDLSIPVIMTNEAGASVYSASQCARDEFPDLDLTVRGAISIGRRLIDPLAELVKIDPKAIGVGQYQHDVDQKLLKESLANTVISCVNGVGVELNTASKELLSYVAGLNKKSAQNIIDYRKNYGGFTSRKELLKVKGIGAKAYEQAAGFLRVNRSKIPLDRSSVHPERYSLVNSMADDLGVDIESLMSSDTLRKSIELKKYISDDIGLPTLKDILNELSKPGRDPRSNFELFEFDKNIKTINDLEKGLQLPGIVTNVTAFGAFVDIGVHQDGLVHISQLSNSFVKNPADVVKAGEKVKVLVLDVDIERKRISLSMKI